MAEATASLTGRQKAAILCITLGPEASSRLFKGLPEADIEQLTLDIAACREVTPEQTEQVLSEFVTMATARRYVQQGGMEYARRLLEQALGAEKARDILHRLKASLEARPLEVIRRTDPAQLLGFVQSEHPQTVALLMTHMAPEQAAIVLAGLPQERQADVVRRAAQMGRVVPEMLKEAERVLERKLSALTPQTGKAQGGIEWVVDVMNRVDRTTERKIMEVLAQEDAELAEEIKKRMFLFEDVVKLDDRAVQRVLREVDLARDLPLAMKVASEAVWRKITQNLSLRNAENLKETVELMGPVRIRDVEEAQNRIVDTIRRLEESGQIVINRGGGEELVV